MSKKFPVSSNNVNHDEKVAVLKSNAVFASLEDTVLDLLAEIAREVTFNRGQTVVSEGDAGTRLFVVFKGTVKIYKRAASGAIIEICRRSAGEMFGELALLDGGPRSASVDAVSKTVLLEFERELFLGILKREPAAVDGLLRWLGSMMREANTLNADLAFLDVRKRIARRILQLSGDAQKDLIRTDRVTQAELAQMVGSSRQTVNGALALLEHDGFIKMDVEGIRITDAGELKRLVL